MSKTSKTYRLSENTLIYIDTFAKDNGISNTAALEKIIKEHEKFYNGQGDQIAELVVKKIENKYTNMFTRMRLATTMSDRNTQVILEILNTLLIHSKITTAYTSAMTKSNVWIECEETVKEMIARYKQMKDHKSK